MNAAFRQLAAFAACMLISMTSANSAQTVAKSNPYSGYIQLDGKWYGVTSTVPGSYDPIGKLMLLDHVTATSCRRSSGAWPSIGGSNVVLVGLGTPMSYMASKITMPTIVTQAPVHSSLPVIMTITTSDGDIVCQGQVAAPDMTPPQPETPLFINGFD